MRRFTWGPDFPACIAVVNAISRPHTDFSDAAFKEGDDLAQAVFAHPPVLTRTARVTGTTPGRVEGAPSSQALTIVLVLMAGALLFYIIRAK